MNILWSWCHQPASSFGKAASPRRAMIASFNRGITFSSMIYLSMRKPNLEILSSDIHFITKEPFTWQMWRWMICQISTLRKTVWNCLRMKEKPRNTSFVWRHMKRKLNCVRHKRKPWRTNGPQRRVLTTPAQCWIRLLPPWSRHSSDTNGHFGQIIHFKILFRSTDTLM